ncbi:hypothetical protein PIB30_028172 [Stylosanthes scabra]|uniref:Uncharacterized protein n=1 Tax=Stylosanthes scabra TaxID=79078 RepID=A0ABU6ZC33_9FABA|nr:hypothetical protein [Stylosanthes scabra]
MVSCDCLHFWFDGSRSYTSLNMSSSGGFCAFSATWIACINWSIRKARRTPSHRLFSLPLLLVDLRTTTASDLIMKLVSLFVLLRFDRDDVAEELRLVLEVLQQKLPKAQRWLARTHQ